MRPQAVRSVCRPSRCCCCCCSSGLSCPPGGGVGATSSDCPGGRPPAAAVLPSSSAVHDRLKTPGVGSGRTAGRRPRRHAVHRVLGEERLAQVVPGVGGDDGVDPRVRAGEHERQGAAVGLAGHADDRVAGGVLRDLRPAGEVVDHPARVRHLVVRGVEVHEAAGGAEAAGGVREDDVPVVGEVRGVLRDRVLGAAVPVREEHGGREVALRRAGGQVEGGAEVDRRAVRLAGAADDDDLLAVPGAASRAASTATPPARTATPTATMATTLRRRTPQKLPGPADGSAAGLRAVATTNRTAPTR